MKLFLILFLTIILIVSACAIEPQKAPTTAPVIKSVSGTNLAHNEIYKIQGTNFGIKNPVEPVKYDDFENATVGQTIGNGWYILSSNIRDPIIYSSERPNGKSTISVRQNFMSNMSYLNIMGLRNQDEAKYYISFKRYTTGDIRTRNYKPLGIYYQEQENMFAVPEFRNDVSGQMNYSLITTSGCNGEFARSWFNSQDIGLNQWDTMEYYTDMGINSTNSSAKRWYNGKLRSTLVGPRIDCGKKWNNLFVNYYFATLQDQGETYNPRAQFWIDNVYIDNTQARIIVCDVSTWSQKENNGAKCNIQVPYKTWNVTEIGFKANQGDFTDGQVVYLYIVNPAGLVNTNGYPIRFGQKVIPIEDQPNVEQTP